MIIEGLPKYEFSQSVLTGLKNKLKKHRTPSFKITLKDLKDIFKRGVGAFKTNPQSVRPQIKALGKGGAEAWAYSRVNAFLRKKSKAGFDQDIYRRIKKRK